VSVESAAALLRRQAGICGDLGSELYRVLLEAAAGAVQGREPATKVVPTDDRAGEPEWAMPLRLMAAVHRLVLQGRASELAEFYPSVGGGRPAVEAPVAFFRTLKEHAEELPELIALPCQTNEVGRSAGLVLGFLEAAGSTGLPLRLLEIGTSASLNLRWDRFRYESGSAAWGPEGSPVRLVDRWDREPEVFANPAEVSERVGCDPNPIDPATEEGSLAIRASVWADQVERFKLLDGALEIAREVPAMVERAGAGEWLEWRLAAPVHGVCTVVYHSVVWQYMTPDEQERVRAVITAAGKLSTGDAPVAWLRMEPEEVARLHKVDLTIWQGGEPTHTRLATAGPHGVPVVLAETS
jgi:hypothetical protein